MRLLSASVAGVAIWVSGCAAISGLEDYGEMPGDASVALTQPATDAATPSSDSSTYSIAPDDTGLADDASDPDATSADANSSDAEQALDAIPACTAQSCPNGCCDAQGRCTGGRSTSTCGSGGEACRACSGSETCSGAGACVTPVVDAAPAVPMCTSASNNTCQNCGIAQTTCCKSDHTCGCAYPFAPCL